MVAADGRAVINFLTGQNDFQAQERFLEALNTPDESRLLELPGFTGEAVADATNAQALAKMDQLARRTLVALDNKCRPKGLAKRDAIVTHMLVKLASWQCRSAPRRTRDNA